MTDAPRVLALVGDTTGCAMWRVWQPYAELQKRGFKTHWKFRDDDELNLPEFIHKLPYHFDALVLPRLWWPDHHVAERFIGALHQAGMAVIYEVDDDLFSPSISDRQYALFPEGHESLESVERERAARVDALQLCDGVTVSSQRLATICAQFIQGKPVEVVPNAIDAPWFRQTLHGVKRVVPPLTIGWSGGTRYAEDVLPMAEAWGRIARRYPNVTFVVQGHMLEALIDAVPADRVRRLSWLPCEEYPRALLNIDIGCAAVSPKPFNTAKTPIKLWEYTLAGAPVVASPTLYGKVSSHGEDVLLAESADEWEASLSALVEQPSLRRDLVRNQRRRIATTHTLAHNWWRWLAAWDSILTTFRDGHRVSIPSGDGAGLLPALP